MGAMTALRLLQQAQKALQNKALNPFQESLWILADVMGLPPDKARFAGEDLGTARQKAFWGKIQRRQKGEPLAYILKSAFFYGRDFYVEPGVFIPRQETAVLVEWAEKRFQGKRLEAVDFGAGAGSICLSLLKALPQSRFTALDISPKALEILQKNSGLFKVQDRLSVFQKDVGRLNKKDLRAGLNLITANPPYIDPEDKACSKEVRLFEPPLALFSDKGGMGHIFSWFEKALALLPSGGIYAFEMGYSQSDRLRAFLTRRKRDLLSYDIHQDQGGRDRIAVCFKK